MLLELPAGKPNCLELTLLVLLHEVCPKATILLEVSQ